MSRYLRDEGSEWMYTRRRLLAITALLLLLLPPLAWTGKVASVYAVRLPQRLDDLTVDRSRLHRLMIQRAALLSQVVPANPKRLSQLSSTLLASADAILSADVASLAREIAQLAPQVSPHVSTATVHPDLPSLAPVAPATLWSPENASLSDGALAWTLQQETTVPVTAALSPHVAQPLALSLAILTSWASPLTRLPDMSPTPSATATALVDVPVVPTVSTVLTTTGQTFAAPSHPDLMIEGADGAAALSAQNPGVSAAQLTPLPSTAVSGTLPAPTLQAPDLATLQQRWQAAVGALTQLRALETWAATQSPAAQLPKGQIVTSAPLLQQDLDHWQLQTPVQTLALPSDPVTTLASMTETAPLIDTTLSFTQTSRARAEGVAITATVAQSQSLPLLLSAISTTNESLVAPSQVDVLQFSPLTPTLSSSATVTATASVTVTPTLIMTPTLTSKNQTTIAESTPSISATTTLTPSLIEQDTVIPLTTTTELTDTALLTASATVSNSATLTTTVAASDTTPSTPTATISTAAELSATATLSSTAVQTPTATPGVTESVTPTATLTDTQNLTPTATLTDTQNLTPTATLTDTQNLTPTATLTDTQDLTPTASATATQVPTAAATLTATQTLTSSISVSQTQLLTSTRTVSPTTAVTATTVLTNSATVTPTTTVSGTAALDLSLTNGVPQLTITGNLSTTQSYTLVLTIPFAVASSLAPANYMNVRGALESVLREGEALYASMKGRQAAAMASYHQQLARIAALNSQIEQNWQRRENAYHAYIQNYPAYRRRVAAFNAYAHRLHLAQLNRQRWLQQSADWTHYAQQLARYRAAVAAAHRTTPVSQTVGLSSTAPLPTPPVAPPFPGPEPAPFTESPPAWPGAAPVYVANPGVEPAGYSLPVPPQSLPAWDGATVPNLFLSGTSLLPSPNAIGHEELTQAYLLDAGILNGVGGLQDPLKGPITTYWGGQTVFQSFHTGVDIAAPEYTPIRAAAAGLVVWAGYAVAGQRHDSYGLCVVIRHNSVLSTLYAHMDDQVNGLQVRTGDIVQAGQVIGYVGMTGWTTGPHLHFETRYNNIQFNPLLLLPDPQQ